MTQPALWGAPRIGDPIVPPATSVSPETFADRTDDSLDALLAAHTGAARPAYAVAGTLWRSSVDGAWRLFDGADDHRVATTGGVASYAADTALTLADVLGGTVLLTAAAVVTIPAEATEDLPLGVPLRLIRAGTGAVSVAAASGVTLSSAGGLTAIAAQHGVAHLIKTGADAWTLWGDLG
ncbi:hypothetical protein ACQ5SO_17290 [Rhodovulum sp. DZ06]|uniref:hypothetical protein n=1 Tax=Rhodovulum sp. DZ06 TaxID=3425126 RepID=UPI003D331216